MNNLLNININNKKNTLLIIIIIYILYNISKYYILKYKKKKIEKYLNMRSFDDIYYNYFNYNENDGYIILRTLINNIRYYLIIENRNEENLYYKGTNSFTPPISSIRADICKKNDTFFKPILIREDIFQKSYKIFQDYIRSIRIAFKNKYLFFYPRYVHHILIKNINNIKNYSDIFEIMNVQNDKEEKRINKKSYILSGLTHKQCMDVENIHEIKDYMITSEQIFSPFTNLKINMNTKKKIYDDKLFVCVNQSNITQKSLLYFEYSNNYKKKKINNYEEEKNDKYIMNNIILYKINNLINIYFIYNNNKYYLGYLKNFNDPKNIFDVAQHTKKKIKHNMYQSSEYFPIGVIPKKYDILPETPNYNLVSKIDFEIFFIKIKEI